MANWKLISGIILGVLLLIGAGFYFGPVKESTIGSYEPIGISCQQKTDCTSFFHSQGASDNDIANINYRCEQNTCEVSSESIIDNPVTEFGG